MKETICGAKCEECMFSQGCKGCTETNGSPFGGKCILSECVSSHSEKNCNVCNNSCEIKRKIINEFNALNIPGMGKISKLYALKGEFVNVEYNLENGQKIKLLNDNDIYLGTQIQKENSDRCYGLSADDKQLVICEYGENGKNAELIIYKKR